KWRAAFCRKKRAECSHVFIVGQPHRLPNEFDGRRRARPALVIPSPAAAGSRDPGRYLKAFASRSLDSARDDRYLGTIPTKSRTRFSSGIANAFPPFLRNQNALDEPPS